jgi:hypothetical protein
MWPLIISAIIGGLILIVLYFVNTSAPRGAAGAVLTPSERRLWAMRVIEKAGFPIGSMEAKVLIDMLIWASKHTPKQVPISESVLISAIRMQHNQTAIAKLADVLIVHPAAAENALAKLPIAAIGVAVEHGMTDFAKWAKNQ